MKKALLLIGACVSTALITLSFKGNEGETHEYVTLTYKNLNATLYLDDGHGPTKFIRAETKEKREGSIQLIAAINQYESQGYTQKQYDMINDGSGYPTYFVVMQK